MQIGERIRALFKAAPTIAPPAPEQAWSGDSLLYAGSNFPKYNPDDLIGRKGFSIYRKMMTDEQVKAVVRFKRDAITSRDWGFEFTDCDELSDEEKDRRVRFFSYCVKRMRGSFLDSMNGVMSAMYNGFSMTEKVFEIGKWEGKAAHLIKALRLRPFDTFQFYADDFGNITKIEQVLTGRRKVLPGDIFIRYVQNPDIDEHYGGSELREAYRSYYSKDIAIRMQNLYLERMAGGFIWAEPEKGKNLDPNTLEYRSLQSALSSISTRTSMIAPSGVALHVEHPASTDAYERAIAQHDKAIAKALLVPNLLGITEQGQTGSYSQSQTQLEAFLWTLDSDATRLEEALNEQLFADLAARNFADGLFPRFKFKPVSESRKHEIIRLWKELVAGGAVQVTETDEGHLRGLLEFPDKPELAEDVAPEVTLNGSQILAVIDIAAKVGEGKLSQDAAVALIVAAFPISEEIAKRIVATEPAEKKEAPAAPGATGQEDDDEEPEETIVGRGVMRESRASFKLAQARVDFAVIDKRSTDAVAASVAAVAAVNGKAIRRLIEAASKIGYEVERVDDLRFASSELSAMKKAVMSGIEAGWEIGKAHARRELGKADHKRFDRAYFELTDRALQDIAGEFLKMRGHKITGSISEATQNAIQNTLMNGIKNSTPWEDTHEAIYAALASDGLIDPEDIPESIAEALGTGTERGTLARIGTIMRTEMFEAINEARYEYFSDPALEGFVVALEYSAILDDRTTEICEHLDGHQHAIDSEVWGKYSPPNHFNCRSLLIPITERDQWEESPEPTIDPQKGF